MTPARLRWGLILIGAGVLFLLENMDILPSYFFFDLVAFLPFILIGVGIEKVFTNSRFQAISYLAVVLTIGGAIYASLGGDTVMGTNDEYFEDVHLTKDFDEDVSKAAYTVRLEKGNLNISESTDQLLDARFRRYTPKPRVRYDYYDDIASVELTPRSGGSQRIVHIETDEPDAWDLALTNRVPVELECVGEDAHLHLSLTEIPVVRVRIDADDSDIHLRLANLQREVDVIVDGEESSLRLWVPSSSGVQLMGFRDSSRLAAQGLISDGRYFYNVGFDTASVKYFIETGPGLENTQVGFYDQSL